MNQSVNNSFTRLTPFLAVIVLVILMVFGLLKAFAETDIPRQAIAQIVEQQRDSRLIMVGESHTRYDHHLVQLEFLRQLHAANPDLVIGVEWFQQPYQAFIDDYIAGNGSEQAMLEGTEYFTRWRYDYRLYRPIMQYARDHAIPVVALNVSRELQDAIRQHGIEQVPAALQSQLPDAYDFDDQRYRSHLKKIFDMHPNYPGDFEKFYLGQLTWDEGMAQAIASYLTDHPERQMLVFAGSGHIEYDSGIPSRVTRRTGIDPTTVLLSDDPASIPAEAASHILASTEISLPKPGRFGIILEERDELLKIRDFAADSVLRDAGLNKGDVIVSIDGKTIQTYMDLKIAMLDKLPGDQVLLEWLSEALDHAGSPRSLAVVLR